MAKKESTLVNMVYVLFVVSAVAGLALGYVYSVTKEPIELAKKQKIENAIKDVLPEFNILKPSYKIFAVDGVSPSDSLIFYDAFQDSSRVGTAVETYTMKGFSGLVKLMVGFKPDGSIHNISVLEHKETPGLGTKMADPKFKDQFENKNPLDFTLKVKKDGGQVDAITAATISSRAFCDATQRAWTTFSKTKGGTE
jgi:electron transport complex protein RnfG